jgi:gliding motility-associated-like protein
MKKFFKLFLTLLLILQLTNSFAQVTNINFEGGQPSCFQASDGFIVFKGFDFIPGRPAGPIPNFTFGFPGTPPTRVPVSVGDTIKNLVSGSYFIEVIDNGSYYREDSTLAFVTSISSFKLPTAVSCFGESNGSIALFPNGGNGAPFTFLWDDVPMSTTQNLSNAPQGTYNVRITDSKGCIATAIDSIGTPPQININLTIDSVDCNGGFAIATIAPTGGGGSYPTIEWSSKGIDISPTRFVEGGLTGSLVGTNYSVTVTDNSGCSQVESFSILEPVGLTLSVAPDTINCFGGATGIADATVNGGTPPYTYDWPGNPGSSLSTQGGFIAGIGYSLRVEDANGCDQTVTFDIEERDELTLGLDSVDVICNGDVNGSVTGTITGGVGPYSWSANDPAGTIGNTANISVPNLNGGKIIITVNDFLGCPKTDSIVVNEPLPLIASFLNTTEDPNCAGFANGKIDVSFSGGNGGETFSWTGPSINATNQTQQNITNLLEGAYVLTITDSKNCAVTIDTTLADPDPILAGLAFDPPSCLGGNDGRIVSTPTDGSGIYINYEFGDGINTLQNSSDSILSGLSAGTYFVTITDSDNCIGTGSIAVTEPTNLFELDIVADSVNCNGESTGGAIATPKVPLTTGPYTWSWTNSGGIAIGTNDSIIAGLPIGKYFISATDGNGCQIIDSVEIEEPNPIGTAIVGANLNCNGDGSGSATANISNGNSPFAWSWNTTPPQNGTGAIASATNLDANIKYILTVTDREGCIKKDSITLSEPTNFDLFLDSFKLVKCFGENNGAMFLSNSGGTAGAGFPTYVWSDGPTTTQDRTDLIASVTPYKIVATDANGCKDSVIQLISEPAPFTVIITNTDSVNCNGSNDGSATALATGGTEGTGYIYTWNTVPIQIGATATGLAPGTYSVVATDSNNCVTALVNTTIFEPTAMTTLMTSDSSSCSGFNDGSATVTAADGTPFTSGSTYTYLWDAAAAGQITATATNLLANAPAFYVVTVTDKNGCEKKDSVQVGQPNTLTLAIINQRNIDCAGNTTGEATVDVVGGSIPYQFNWVNTGSPTVSLGTNATQGNLPADTFLVTVTDAGGCNDDITVIITQPDSLKASITSSISPSCLGSTDGSATITVTGGSLLPASDYAYSWNTTPVQTTATATGLEADRLYVVTVTDDSLCFMFVTVTLTAPNVFVTSDSNMQDVSCFGGNDGFIRLTPVGGTPFPAPASPYTITWTLTGSPLFTANGDSIFNLISGQYVALIEDSRGCLARDTFDLNQPGTRLSLTFDTTDVSCAGFNNGTVKVNVIGGTPGYTYRWIGTGFGNVDSIFGLSTGTYRVEVTDANLCTGLDSTIVNPATPITLSLDPANPVEDVTCAGDQDGSITITANGGVGVLGLEWYLLPDRINTIATNTSSVTNLSGGTYRILVIDGPCSDSLDVVVNEPDSLKAELNKYDVSCDGTILGRAAVNNITGGNTGGQSFTWIPDPGIANGGGTDSVFNLLAGNYSVRVFDLEGCDTTIVFSISATSVTFNFTDSVRNDSCVGAGKGYVGIIGISGGVAPYTYEWSTNPGVIVTNSFIDNLTTGTYSVIIRDDAGCDSNHVFTLLSEPIPFNVTFDTTNVSCAGADNGTIKVNVIGGTSPYEYEWIGTAFGDVDSIFGLVTGTYRVEITDGNGCKTLDSTTVNPASPIILAIDPASPGQDVSCAGNQDGTINITATGGGSTLIKEWFLLPNRTTPIAGDVFSLSNLSGGTYRVIVIDGPCLDSLDFTVNEPDTLKAELNKYDINCSGTTLGHAAIRNITGGNTGGQSFTWLPDPGAANGGGTDSVFNLAAGNYSVRVFDFEGCDTTIGFTISQAISAFTFVDSVRNDSCIGAGKGYVGIENLAGGATPFTFEWSTNPGVQVNNPSLDNLTTGNYSVTITDGTGCDSIFNFPVLTEPDTFRVSVIAIEDTCLNSVGSASIDPTTLTGGTPPYAFTWPGGISGQAVTGLLGDITYQLTITDANKCTYTEDFAIGNKAPFVILFDIDSVTCEGFPNGAIRVTTPGQPVGLTTYSWFPAITGGASPTGLLAGTYSLNVTDAAGCVATGLAEVGEPDKLLLDSVITISETCVPGSDGSAVAFASGGNSSNRYNWRDASGSSISGGFNASNTISNLTAGDYTVVVQDRKFCSNVANFRIANTAPFKIDSITVEGVTCRNSSDGSILVHLSDTIPVVSYNWSVASLSGPNPTGLLRGSYFLTVTDGTTCEIKTLIPVVSESNLQSLVTSHEDETCSPGTDGWAVVGGVSGIEPYTYSWGSNVTFGALTDSAFNLVAGDYFVTTTDSNMCTSVAAIRIQSGANLGYDVLAQTNPLCFGDVNGSVRINARGGVAPYTYRWSNGSTDSIANNLTSGNITVTITDNSIPPCEKPFDISIIAADPFSIDVATTIETCLPGNDARATVTPTGTGSPFTYTFSPGGTVGSSNNIYENLAAGTYGVSATNSSGCSANRNFTIIDASTLPFTANIQSKKNPTCANGADGEFFVNVVAGSNPITFVWSGGNGQASAADPDNLTAGIYTVTVSDANGCEIVRTDTLFDKAPISVSYIYVKDDCPATNTGSVTATAADGLFPYSYGWPIIIGSSISGTSGETFSNLPSGTFEVTITDASGCVNRIPFTIESSAPFTLVSAKDDISCNGLSDGSISLSVSTPGVVETYLWDANVGAANVNNQNQTNLAIGTYKVTVTDPTNPGCEETETFIIIEPDTIGAAAVVTNVSCTGGGTDGTITLSPTGGNSPYFYDWGNGINTKDRSGLQIGSYNVIITDDNGCQFFPPPYVVNDLPQFTVSLSSTDISCPGARDGFIAVTTDANGPTYAWSDGNTDRLRGGLFSGKYIVTVTDAISGCTVKDSVFIDEQDSIKMFFSVIGENCFPGGDGIAKVDSSKGGTPTYTYSFSAGTPVGSDAVNQLSAGTVVVTITDQLRCTAVDSFVVEKEAPFAASFIFTDAICQGDSSGTASIITNPGRLFFDWPLGSVLNRTDSTQSKLLAGTYVVNVFDPANGCDEDLTIIIDEPDTIKANAIIVDENCNPGGNGSITISPTGGDSGPYTFAWSGNGVSVNSQNQANLSAGKYFITMSDGITCERVDSFTVGFIVTTIPNLTTLNDGCQTSGLCVGAAQASPTGGVAPYTFEWTSPSGVIPVPLTTDSIGNLCAGAYSVKITDNSGCDTTVTFTIVGKRTIIPNEFVEDETCGATANGSISVTPTGGQEPYSYVWSMSTVIDSNRTNVAPGNYFVTITDATGCDTVINITVGTENFDYTINSTDLSCNGGSDGTADILIVGSTAGFTFNWTPAPTTGQGTANISNLSIGAYSVIITNTNNGCAVTEIIDIRPSSPINPNEVATDESCFGQNDGTIVLGTVGGAGGYSYSWSPNVPLGTTDNATGLSAGAYDVTVTDASGCDTSISVIIIAANEIIASIVENDATCTNTGICDGSAELTVTSSGLFSYTWSPGIIIVGNDSAAINLCPGNYFVDITNAEGCSKRVDFVIGGPAAITANIAITNSTCNLTNGELTASPAGGTGILTVEWLDNNFASIGTGNTVTTLSAGAYFAVVVDATGCRDTFPTNINDIGSENISITDTTNVSCFGGNDGTATVSFICNDPSCITEWFRAGGTSVGTGKIITGLSAGNYYVEVTNNSGCLAVETVPITEPSGFSISESILSNVCFDGINGSVTLSVSGGAGGFSYLWSPAPTNGQGTNSISGLAAGAYTVTILDANGCDSTMSFNITEPSVIAATFATTNSNCNQTDGQITATATGGTVATPLVYDYQWFNGNNVLLVGETTDTLKNVGAGNYRLRVRDDNACQQDFSVSISDLNGPTVAVDSILNAGCFGESNGAVFIAASGINPPFNFTWSPTGAVSEDLTNVIAGIYSVQVTDALGCITNLADTVREFTELIANISVTDATCGECNGAASVILNGGTAPYSYLWSNGQTANNADSLCGGIYTLVVTDASNCSKSFDFGVNTTGGPTGETVSITSASCANSSDGAATITPIGGTPPYSYVWQHNGATSSSLSNLSAGTYFVQISDVRSCSRTVQIDITSPTALVLNPSIITSTCLQADGSILLNVTGGQGPYSYNWGTATTADTNFIDGRAAGLYPVNVTDANGCTENTTVALNNTGLPFTPNPTVTDVNCFGQCDGSLISNITGVPVDYTWLDAQRNTLAPMNTDLQNSVCAGNYFLEILTAPQGCKSYISVSISEPDSITLSSSIVKDISCNGDCDGKVFINTTGGNILYNYSWSDPNNQNQIPANSLCAGTYTVTATDANGCTAETSVTLTDPPLLNASITSNTNLICSSDCDATATSIVSGGNPPYQFNWSGGQISQNPNNLCFGINVLTVTDARSCSVTDTIFVSAIDTVITESFGAPLICDGQLVTLSGTVTGSSITSFGWYLVDATTLFTTTLDTSFARPIGNYTYLLIATSGTCSDTVKFDVTVVPNPIVNLQSEIRRFGDEPVTIILGNDDPSYTYEWTPGADLDDSTIAEPVTVSEIDITYTLMVTDTNGCTFEDSLLLLYFPNIDIPSGFTPNGDGNNDVWNIRLLEKYPNTSVQIYNRWGTLLFEQPNGYRVAWNGKYKGKDLPIGTYYYIIDVKDQSIKPLSGPITIIR